jgi:phosphatidylinositol alpha-mannosyltransferase
MRIALLHPFSWPAVRRGGERYAHDLAWWLAGQGHDVDYVTAASDGAASTEESDGARLVRLPLRYYRKRDRLTRPGLDGYALTVRPWLAANRYDVVHSFSPTAAVAAAGSGHRVVFTGIGHPVTLTAPERAADRRGYQRAVRRAAVATALSASAAAAGEQLTGIRPRVLNPGIRLDLFSSRANPQAKGPPRLLFAADASDPRKRVRVALAAMPAVLDARADARLVIGGPGQLPDAIPDRVRAAVNVIGVGEADQVADRYRQATVTVLPSVDEGFGLVLVESLACGTPVVASNSGGMPEIVAPGIGELFQTDDPDDLAQAIINAVTLSADPSTARRCAEHAARWGWDVIGPQHLAAYQDAVATR